VRHILGSAILLGLFAVVGSSLVGFTYEATRAQIAENERLALLRALHAVVEPDMHDNDLYADVITVTDPQLLGTRAPVSVYRARMGEEAVAAVLAPVAPDGYAGTIRLLVGIDSEGTITGVRVLAHRETPGLGDLIEERRSNWILRFTGRSLENPHPSRWRVKKDGGVFDQFSGATVTPRAVVKAVHNALVYFERHQDALFEPLPGEATTEVAAAPAETDAAEAEPIEAAADSSPADAVEVRRSVMDESGARPDMRQEETDERPDAEPPDTAREAATGRAGETPDQ
jgi:Na+-translocating ferredoxin:NAD+ oxidoreductase subunit G